MAGRTYEQNPFTGKWVDASEARSYRSELKKNSIGKEKEIEQRIGSSKKFPEGRYTTAQMRQILRSGDLTKGNNKGKIQTIKITSKNKEDVLSKRIDARVVSSGATKNLLIAAGGGGQRGSTGTVTRLRGTEGNIKKTTGGAGRGKAPVIPRNQGIKGTASKTSGSGKSTRSSSRIGGGRAGGRGKK